MYLSIIRLSVYRAKRNVGQFPFEEKKKWMLVFPETAPSLESLKTRERERERARERERKLIVRTEDQEVDSF